MPSLVPASSARTSTEDFDCRKDLRKLARSAAEMVGGARRFFRKPVSRYPALEQTHSFLSVSPSKFYVHLQWFSAANHYVRAGATGNADGTDWTNAWTDLPASLTRGDTYYIADGTYGVHMFYDAVSGSTYIYIKKAIPSDHGTGTGWSDSYGQGQALFTTSSSNIVWNIAASYMSFEGQVGSVMPTGPNGAGVGGQGIRVYSTQNNESTPPIYCQNGYTYNYLIFRHIEVQGPPHGSSNAVRIFWINSLAAMTGLTIQYCYFHEAGRAWISMGYNFDQVLIERNYFLNCGSNDNSIHCAGIIWGVSTTVNMTIRYNILENMVGPAGITSYFEPQTSGGSGVDIYGNVIWATDPNETSSPGVICYTGSDYGSFNFYCNTIYGLHGACGVYAPSAAGTINVRDNIWQNCTIAPTFTNVTSQNNNILNTGEVSFVDTGNGNFHLSASTEAGVDLGIPYNIDPDGVVRGADGNWDIGAFQYGGISPSPIKLVMVLR